MAEQIFMLLSAVCLGLLGLKLWDLSTPKNDGKAKEILDKLTKRNNAHFKQVELVKAKSKERQDRLMERLQTEGVSVMLLEELELEQERLKDELASLNNTSRD